MKCDICGGESSIQICDVATDGTSVERNLCEAHAREEGLAVPSVHETAMTMLPKIRSLANFIRTNDRMPSAPELQQLGGFGDLSDSQPGTDDFNRQLAYLDELADSIERTGRFPTEEELPDPF